MSIWYRATTWTGEPQLRAVEIDRDSGSFVFLNGYREAKRSTGVAWYPERGEAVKWLSKEQERKLDDAKALVVRYENSLAQVLAMREQPDATP